MDPSTVTLENPPLMNLPERFNDEELVAFKKMYENDYRPLGFLNTAKSKKEGSIVQYHSLYIQCKGFGKFETRGNTNIRTKSQKCECTFSIHVVTDEVTGLYKIDELKSNLNHNDKCKIFVAEKKGKYKEID